ncbi:MAG: TVP38/TMEM64 family protein [Candidatus Kariarchaeaceae archaeon]
MTHIVGFFETIPLIIGVTVLLAAFILQTPVLTFPIYFLTIYSGIIYGMWAGSIFNYVGMVATIMTGYYLGSIGKGEKIMHTPAMKKFDEWLHKRGFTAIAFLRIVPIIPYNIVSLGSGLVKLDRARYITVNALAVIPYAIIFAVIGDVYGSRVLEWLHGVELGPLVRGSLIIIAVFIVLYLIIKQSSGSEEPHE